MMKMRPSRSRRCRTSISTCGPSTPRLPVRRARSASAHHRCSRRCRALILASEPRSAPSSSRKHQQSTCPLTVDVNDRLSVVWRRQRRLVAAGTAMDVVRDLQLLRSDFRPTSISRTADMFPTHERSEQRVQRSIRSSAAGHRPATTRSSKASYALDADETRGLLAGVQYTKVLVDTMFAGSSPPSPISWAMSAATISGTTTGNSPAASACSPLAARSF